MKQTRIIEGTTIPLERDDIDTDIIIPAQYLTSTSQTGFGQWAFARLKRQKECVFNEKKYQSANILITGENFGCGSSREHAVWAIQEMGIEAIIASSFADIFANNAKKNGLLLIQQNPVTIRKLMDFSKQQCEMRIEIEQQILTISHNAYSFDIDPFFKHCLVNGLNELDYLMSHKDLIHSFKQKQINKTLFINTQL